MGWPVQRKICCICGVKSATNKSKSELAKTWRKSKAYCKDFGECFGAAAQDRQGDICLKCVNIVNVRYRKNKSLHFHHILDSKLKTGSITIHDHEYGYNLSSTMSTLSTEKSFMSSVSDENESSSTRQPLQDLANVHNLNDSDIPDQEQSTEIGDLHSIYDHPSDNHNCDTKNITVLPSHASTTQCPRKRNREDQPVTRVTRPRTSIERTLRLQFQVKGTIPFLGHELPANVVEHILDFLPKHDVLMITMHFIVQNFQNELTKVKKEIADIDKRTNIPETGPLTQSQKRLLNQLITNRENNVDEHDCIVIPHVGSGGKSKRFLKIPKVQMNSKEATKRTKNKRSQFIEKVEKIISSGKSSEIGIHDQRVNNICRDRTGYAAAAEEAGLKVVTKFSKETILSLRGVMSLRLWRVLKRVFSMEVGWDVFGSVEKMQEELKNVEFKYECGTVTSSTGELVHFVRVEDIVEVVKQMVNELNKAGELIYLDNLEKNQLWLHAAADKGGTSTKLILQVINQRSRHSMDLAKLIGFFEGKDNRVNLEAVFGPLFTQLQECAASIADLKLTLPDATIPISPSNPVEDAKVDENIAWKPLIPFDKVNTCRSSDCPYCKKSQTTRHKPGANCIAASSTVSSSATGDATTSYPLTTQNAVADTAPCTRLLPPSHQGVESTTISLMSPDTSQHGQSMSHAIPNQSINDLPATPSVSSNNPVIHYPCSQGAPTPSRILTDDPHLRRNLFSNPASTPRPSDTIPTPPNECSTEIYTSSRVTIGGDWEGLAKIIGLSGPNGKFFCNHCLVNLDQTPKGIPHAITILPKYRHLTNDDAHILPTGDEFLRTFEGCAEMSRDKEQAGENAKARDYQSCDNKPLLSNGCIIDTVSTTPLHISLGLGLQFLNIIENEAIKLDKKIKDQEGKYEAFMSTFEHKKEILGSCTKIQEKIDKVEDKINLVKERKVKIITERASFFKPDKRGRMNNSELAVGVRETYKNLDKEKATLVKEREKLQKQLSSQEKKLEKVMSQLDQVKGPFKSRLDDLLDNMKLKRAAYHSGALIGPDVKKLVTAPNIKNFAKVFKPFKCENLVVYDHTVQVKIITLLTKFKQCYDLYNANRVLCRHEVELLALRCASLGSWFPVSFPDENLKRKFHLLTVDVPKQARRMYTVGMITEQTIESIHPYINELERRFAKVADRKSRGLIICKQQNVYSQPNWNVVKRRGKLKK